MRIDADAAGGTEFALVYIARRLKDAMRAEAVLTAAGIDYMVEADLFTAGLIFRVKRTGAFFYVPADREGDVLALLRNHGFRLIDESGRF